MVADGPGDGSTVSKGNVFLSGNMLDSSHHMKRVLGSMGYIKHVACVPKNAFHQNSSNPFPQRPISLAGTHKSAFMLSDQSKDLIR